MLKLVPRAQPSRWMSYSAPLLAVLCTLVCAALLFAALGQNPLTALYTFLIKPLDSVYGWGELSLKAAPLALIAAGLALGFRANVWNIGAEGQLVMGAICGGGVALYWHDSSSAWLLPGMLVAGLLGGMAWAAIPAWLRTRANTNEILVSLMLSYVAALLLGYLVHGPWRDPEGFAFPESRMFPDAALFPVLIEGTRLHAGLLLAPLALGASWILLSYTLPGFQLRVAGQSEAATAYAGFSRTRIVWASLLGSGALAGLAGVSEVAGPIGQLLPQVSPGYGFTAIIVAFLGRLHPFGILLASLLMALLYLGGEAGQMLLGLPSAVTGVFQGMLLFFLLAMDVLIRFRLVWHSGGAR